MEWTAEKLQRLFGSRNARRAQRPCRNGLFIWWAAMIRSGLLNVEEFEYEAAPTPRMLHRMRYQRGDPSEGHRQLSAWAMTEFESERPGWDLDIVGYGSADVSTTERIVECGSTPPVKLLRAWAIGHQRFTVFPFVELMGHRYVTLSVPCEWPLKPPTESGRGAGRLLAGHRPPTRTFEDSMRVVVERMEERTRTLELRGTFKNGEE